MHVDYINTQSEENYKYQTSFLILESQSIWDIKHVIQYREENFNKKIKSQAEI